MRLPIKFLLLLYHKGKSSAIQYAAQDPLENLGLTDAIISKTTSSGLVKLLAKKKKGMILSPEIFDILNKLLKSDEDNATGDIQLLCKLFSGERCSYHFSTEESRLILPNTPFCLLGSTQLPWPRIDSTEEYLSECPTKKCHLTYDVYDIRKSDLIIFHAGDMPAYVKSKEIQQIHRYRCPQQRMAFLNQESIVNDPDLELLLSLPEGFFNWTITFKRESDFHFPYAHYIPLPSSERPAKIADYAVGKTKLVSWAVSRCGRTRDKYVKTLLKYIKVDVYGHCSGIFGQDNRCPRSSNCDDLFSSYKFYLAFENSVCTDYITEKFWRTLGWNSVPITLTRDFYTPDIVPPGSFISVQDFPSVKALAEYLLYLDKNDTAYNEYFKWKKEFAYKRKLRFRYAACDICDALHNECLKPKFYKDVFKTFWNDDVDCKKGEDELLQLIEKEEG
ncbi:Glycoprotein 3-alpha-L-fucosyltransferase A [Stylophora pistillata]|uniref:Fucosyltransferase n=1 Tax=Stylophora pistillata TaxID=50429 RepID=A0A2B4SXV1_STYPI|nr:Glycoprotein 3-alpha-L-fucosyltransferase A [Stylophora pistillata]